MFSPTNFPIKQTSLFCNFIFVFFFSQRILNYKFFNLISRNHNSFAFQIEVCILMNVHIQRQILSFTPRSAPHFAFDL